MILRSKRTDDELLRDLRLLWPNCSPTPTASTIATAETVFVMLNRDERLIVDFKMRGLPEAPGGLRVMWTVRPRNEGGGPPYAIVHEMEIRGAELGPIAKNPILWEKT